MLTVKCELLSCQGMLLFLLLLRCNKEAPRARGVEENKYRLTRHRPMGSNSARGEKKRSGSVVIRQ